MGYFLFQNSKFYAYWVRITNLYSAIFNFDNFYSLKYKKKKKIIFNKRKNIKCSLRAFLAFVRQTPFSENRPSLDYSDFFSLSPPPPSPIRSI